ncbi:DUF364 domain-containing protein [Candidatus Albibeggiatoa sp. nov. BB20]|uniref:DUF364 domain-containing protein n=1 Tax=Candidatus Albibeggiatoa sp. nov. BB20 TaxID=3162723 RepID=UPI003365A598
MSNPNLVYDLLLDSINTSTAHIDSLLMGLVWTQCRNNQGGIGLTMTLPTSKRTISWSGTMRNRKILDIAQWIRSWDMHEAIIGQAAINSVLSQHHLPDLKLHALPHHPIAANLAVFDYFLPQLKGQKVAIVGRYPHLEKYEGLLDLTVIERNPHVENDVLDSACEFVLPQSDWVFLTATSLTNKTFPRLAELSKSAHTVLMGPSVPWLPDLVEFDIDFLAGVTVEEPQTLYQTIAEGGGTRIFDQAVRYHILDLRTVELSDLKSQIADTVVQRDRLKVEMEQWYQRGLYRFPKLAELELIDQRLSELDAHYKRLWDARHFPTPKVDLC